MSVIVTGGVGGEGPGGGERGNSRHLYVIEMSSMASIWYY